MPTDNNSKIILLTGFEPFGNRTENISWDAVKNLEGQSIGPYTIKTHQLPVVWGKPLPQLKDQIEKHKPVAIFSFGQGAPSAFKFESIGRNQRGSGIDNKGNKATQSLIVKNGPDTYTTTLKMEKFFKRLTQQGYPFIVSTHAGQYLCDECTYSLHHLQKQHKIKAVGFIHIPPPDSDILINNQTEKMNAKHAEHFAKIFVKTWIGTMPSKKKQQHK